MSEASNPTVILIAEDDDDHFFLMQKAFAQLAIVMDLRRVVDGEELLDYLLRAGRYSESGSAPLPVAILLDINMPKKNGREALEEIKKNPELRHIPVVVLTTSRREEDKQRCYELGANSYIRKPVDFEKLSQMIFAFSQYWLAAVDLPTPVGK